MNRFFTLLLAASCLTAVGQECSEGCIIPDVVGECFAYDFELSQFPPGQIIQDASTEIESLFINLEHSYMGDLVISFICPNGQSIQVHDQGGTNSFLGEPVDDDFDPDTPGIGYNYYWDPGATNGTWGDNSQEGTTLPAGSYESVTPFANLDGCPVNGIWQIELCDVWSLDNGFVFDVGINFIYDFGPGCTDSLACNYNINATEDDGSCTELDECGVCGGEGIAVGNCDCNGNQFDAVGMCGGGCTSDINNNGVCDDQEVPGCTYAFAENYNPDATDDDGSCVSPCVVDTNTNCLDGTVWDEALGGCVPESVTCEVEFDYDGDGTVGSGDLLAFLIAFGASFPDEDADGVCDDIDECIGEYDECGVCNGPGAVYECGCADIPAGDCDCNGNVLDECDVCGGEGIPDGACDCDGNVLGDCVAFLVAPALNLQGYSFTYGVTNWSPLGFDWSNAIALQNVSFEFVPVDSTDFSDVFPNADFSQQVPAGTGGINSSFYEYNPDYYGYWGLVDGASGIQVVHPEALVYFPYPFAEGDEHEDQLTFEFTSAGLVITRSFQINMEGIDGGALLLPNGLSFDNTLRVATRTLVTDSNEFSVSTLLIEGFQYWTQDMPLPVAQTYTYTQIMGGDSSMIISGGEFLVDILDYSEMDGGVSNLSTGFETPSPKLDGDNGTSLPLGFQHSGMSIRCIKD